MSPLVVVAPCWGRIARDHHGVPTAVLLDYWGDAPPEALFAALAGRGWDVPLPAAPPAPAIEWRAQVDPATGRRWTLRPYAVTDALAVAGRGADTDPTELDHLLRLHGVVVDDRSVASLSVPSESASGRATVDLDDEVGPDPASRPPARAWVLGESAGPPAAPVAPPTVAAPTAAPASTAAPSGGRGVDSDGSDGSAAPGGSAVEGTTPARPRVSLDGRPPLPSSRPGWAAPTVVAAPMVEVAVDSPTSPPATRRLFGPPEAASAGSTGAAGSVAAPRVRIVHAVVRNGSVPAVGKVLEGFGLAEAAAVGTATGAGREGGQVTTYRGTRHTQLYPRSWVDVPVPEARVEEVVAALVDAIRIGREGDGKIWVT